VLWPAKRKDFIWSVVWDIVSGVRFGIFFMLRVWMLRDCLGFRILRLFLVFYGSFYDVVFDEFV
jgi:hypothetical protein